MRIISGDIGGTKIRLALYSSSQGSLNPLHEKEFTSREYDSFTAIVSEFMQELVHPPVHACFGVAGPVLGQKADITNLPWCIDANELKDKFSLQSAHLLNDLEATAWGISSLTSDDLYCLQQGSALPNGNLCVTAAGTGLGQAGMVWNGERYIPFASEGGHTDFAPGSQLECELLLHLQSRGRQVCWEDLLSGPGLIQIYRFLLARSNDTEPEWISSVDAAARIAELATSGQDSISVQAMEMFSRMYGAEAGNYALKLMARGGVYIGGGIAPKILPWLQRPEFLGAFTNKGKMHELMASIPVHVILNDRAALYGPAIYLREMVLRR